VGDFRCPDNPAEPNGDVEEVGIITPCPKPETNEAAARAFHDLRDQGSPNSTTPELEIHIEMANSADLGRLLVRILIEPADSHEARSEPSLEQELTRPVESIRARIPVSAHALHCMEVLAEAQPDQVDKVGRKVIDPLDSQSLVCGVGRHPLSLTSRWFSDGAQRRPRRAPAHARRDRQ